MFRLVLIFAVLALAAANGYYGGWGWSGYPSYGYGGNSQYYNGGYGYNSYGGGYPYNGGHWGGWGYGY